MSCKTLVCSFVVVALAALPSSAAPCPDRVGHWPYGPTLGVVASGSTVFFGAGTVLRAADVSDPTNPSIISETAFERRVQGMALVDDTLLVAASERGLVAVNVADPGHPTVVGELGGIGRAHRLWIEDGLAYVGTVTGLFVVDVSDPASLEVVGSVEGDIRYAYGLWVVDDLLYVAATRGGLFILDIADPATPTILSTTDFDSAYGVAVFGSIAYVADRFDGLRVVDVSDPHAPSLVRTVILSSDYLYQCMVVGTHLYVAHRGHGVAVLDLTDPADPAEVARLNTDGEAYDLAADGGRLYVADQYRGLVVADITAPAEPEMLGTIEGVGSVRELSAHGSLAAATSVGDVFFFDISDPSNPTRISTYEPSGWAEDVVLSGELAYVSLDRRGLQIVDLADPANPAELGLLDVGLGRYLAVDGDRAVITDTDVLIVIDVSDPEAPTEVGRMDFEFSPSGLLVAGDVAYLSDYQTGFHIVDLSSPSAPSDVGFIAMEGVSHPAAALDGLLFMGQQGSGLRVLDIADPLAPVEVGVYHDTQYFSGITASGNLVAVASIYSGFHVVDVTDPANPVAVGVHDMLEISEADAAGVGDLVVVAEEESGLEIFDIGDCALSAPVAGFTVHPAIPRAGQAVDLRDASSGPTTSWTWDFGDGEASAEADPVHVWSAAGSYLVTLTVAGPGGVGSTSRVVTVSGGASGSPAITEPGEVIVVVAASAHIAGAAGTQWVTDLVLHNPTANDATVHLYFMERNLDNTAAPGWQILVPAGTSVELKDVVLELFGEEDAAGAILVGSDRDLMVASRTYNDDSTGSYGQFIPGRALSEASVSTDETRLIHLVRNDGYRSNVGCANPTNAELEVTVQLLDRDGNTVDERLFTVPPFSSIQLTDIFAGDVEDGMAIVWSETPDARYFAYASVVDNRTGDPILVQEAAKAQVLYVSAAAHVGGFEGTDWRTDLVCYSDATVAGELTVELLATGQANSSPPSASVMVPPGGVVRTPDALDLLFGSTGTGALRVTASTGHAVVTSRTYNSTDDGTYGQFIPAVSEEQAIPAGAEGRLVQLHQSTSDTSGYRTNLGVLNLTGARLRVGVTLHASDGAIIGSLPIDLEAFEHQQLNRVFTGVTGSAVRNGYAIVSTETPDGLFLAYASVVDNGSGDPVYMPAW